jgi:hypothetical protein
MSEGYQPSMKSRIGWAFQGKLIPVSGTSRKECGTPPAQERLRTSVPQIRLSYEGFGERTVEEAVIHSPS